MKASRTLLLLVVCCVALAACRDEPTPTEITPSATPVNLLPTPAEAQAAPALGNLMPEAGAVEIGRDDASFQPVTAMTTFTVPDIVRVGAGRALLQFSHGLWLRLLDDTQLRLTETDAADPAVTRLHLFLEQGGLTGQVAAATVQAIVMTPAGAEVAAGQSQFFVVYNAETGQTTAANFNGTVEVNDRTNRFPLPAGHYVRLPGGQPVPLEMTLTEFEQLADETQSPLAAVGAISPAQPLPTLDVTAAPVATDTPLPPTATATEPPTLTPTPCGPPAGWILYTILPGDTLGQLARSTGTSVFQLQLANCLTGDRIYYGQALWLPHLPPTRTPTPTLTPTPTYTPTPTETPAGTPTNTPTPTPCPELGDALLSAAGNNGTVTVTWSSTGGCAPFSGTVAAAYEGDAGPYVTFILHAPSGIVTDNPPVRCGESLTIVYSLTLTDSTGQAVIAVATYPITFDC